ncbi:MAG: S8 family serine peptidase [Odoribacteraceae bacterium]|jgi:subtilisin family serine protease|nr:S8 family serine peptidase [Odoribacteraceae bacterium]
MKNTLGFYSLLLLLIISVTACHDQLPKTEIEGFNATDVLYRRGGILVQKMDEKFHVLFRSADAGKVKLELAKVGVGLDNVMQKVPISQYTTGSTAEQVSSRTGSTAGFLGAERFTGCQSATIEGDYENVAGALSHALYWSPYYKLDNGEEIRITELFTVILKPGTSLEELEELARENSVEMIGQDQFNPEWYHFACTIDSKGNALEMANLFYESDLFQDAFPDCIADIKLNCINEPEYLNGSLWHLGNNSTAPNIHINYCNSRTILSQGDSSVIVSIIDDGVQSTHPDLYKVYNGMHAGGGSNHGNIAGITYSHGTMVAGFIGAIPNNGQGVAGIAHGVRIAPISFNQGTPFIEIRNAFYHSVGLIKARVINCSWSCAYNEYILEGIQVALDEGLVVVFASGNSSTTTPVTPVTFPANSDPRILVVGSINANGERSSFSCYGNRLDLVAPGENVCVLSVDPDFPLMQASGTSFSAPQVAAVAAMIISLRPAISSQEVRDIIEKTAQKIPVGTYYTTSKPWGWNSLVGSGLLDAHAALAMADTIPIIGNQIYASSFTGKRAMETDF